MRLKTVKINKLNTKNNVFLAPLAGYTNAVFRQLCYDLGAGLTFTEMVSAKGLCYGSEKTEELLRVTPEYSGIKACQIFGSDPYFMRKACESKALEKFELVDINMGCPVPKIYKNGEGSALMNDMPLAGKIIAECVKSGKIISVKFRTGLTEGDIKAVEFAKVCEGAGASLITVHGRVRERFYSGGVDFKAVAEVKNSVKIPVIANGGVFNSADAEKLYNETGADGIAVARGAMYAPWIFAEICGEPVPDKKALVLKQLEDTLDLYGERFACVFMRKMTAFYIKGMPDCAKLKEKLFKCSTCACLAEIIDGINFVY